MPLPPSSPLPFGNGRPSPASAYSSPLPSPGPSSSIFSSLLASPDPPDAVIEKHRLATGRRSFSFIRPFANYFSSYPFQIPFSHRRLRLPVPNFLYPSSPSLVPSNYRSNFQRHSSILSRRTLAHDIKPKSRLSLIYALLALSAILLAFSKIRAAIRNSTRHIPLPFQDPSTLILSEQEIRRVWEWEIANGHYPSSRRTPTVVGLQHLPNPSLPRKPPLPVLPDLANSIRFDDSLQVPPTRVLQQNQLRAPPSFLDDVIPVGPPRSYMNISSPPVYPLNRSSSHNHPPRPYPPRPVSNAIIDLDVVMDYCDFSTNQYVRDCLEILRMGAGLDVEKRVRRGQTARWRHLFHEHNDDGSVRSRTTRPPHQIDLSELTPMDEEQGEQMINDPSYQPLDVLAMLKSDAYPAKLRALQASHTSADARRQTATRHPSHPTADPTCDAEYPKIFHIFWAGPFTDKPYLALSSFLFTQNLGLDLPLAEHPKGSKMTKEEEQNFARRAEFLSTTCRPQMWVWINPGPAAAIPNPNARGQMFSDLRQNPWSAPFLHKRFREVIKFKMWNTTEQLDGVPELRDHWRELPLFNSGGVKYGSAPAAPTTPHQHGPTDGVSGKPKAPVKIGIVVPEEKAKLADKDGDGQGEAPDVVEEELGRFGNHTRGEAAVAEDMSAAPAPAAVGETANASTPSPIAVKKTEDELFQRVGSTSSKGYDRLSVVLSDMARFVLCHRFGGIYLDADTILLRDWDELWGWRGQFAYRWSRLEKYNTAVLRLHRHSAIGSFLFKTALANGLDFHPMTISRYTKDAYLDSLLLRLPDALFDSAWLNTEYYQRDRPAFPYFKRFEDFFETPKESDAGPNVIGFDGFFRGAFSYHFHNFWWIPFDPSRNWPDLGPRFSQGELSTRAKLLAAKQSVSQRNRNPSTDHGGGSSSSGGGSSSGQTIGRQSLEEIERGIRERIRLDEDDVADDERDLGWATVLKRSFEGFLRCERPNMYGEWLDWDD